MMAMSKVARLEFKALIAMKYFVSLRYNTLKLLRVFFFVFFLLKVVNIMPKYLVFMLVYELHSVPSIIPGISGSIMIFHFVSSGIFKLIKLVTVSSPS